MLSYVKSDLDLNLIGVASTFYLLSKLSALACDDRRLWNMW